MVRLRVLFAASLLLFSATACGDGGDDGDTAGTGGTDTTAVEAEQATDLKVTAKEYAFEVPSTFKGGLIEMSYSNAGKEPHFAAFAKAAPGKTFADVKAALTAPQSAAPPSGPPPFEELAAAPTADPGGSGKLTFNLEAGTYALFCSIPGPDGVPHSTKGMVSEVTVTEGAEGDLPEAVGTVTATDFALSAPPDLDAGTNVVKLRNDGKQLHEINLVELSAGKTVDDVVAWAKAPAGPPPHKSLSGVAVKPGAEGTAEFDLEEGASYAFICVIPDVLGDFKPHATKGMYTAGFKV